MKFDTFTIDGEEFLVREITMYKGTPEEFDTFIGGTDLLTLIMLDDNEEKYKAIDEQLIFFVSPEELRSMSDEELIELVSKQISC